MPTLPTLATLRASPMSKSSTVLKPVSSITRIRSSSGSDTAHAEPGRSISSTSACSTKPLPTALDVSPRRALRLKPGNAANASGLSGAGVGATTGPHVPRAHRAVPSPAPAPDLCGFGACWPPDAASSFTTAVCGGCGAHGDPELVLPPGAPCGAAPKADTPKGTALPAPNAHGSGWLPAGAPPDPLDASGATVWVCGGCTADPPCTNGCAGACCGGTWPGVGTGTKEWNPCCSTWPW